MGIKMDKVFLRLGIPYEDYKPSYNFKGSSLDEQIKILAGIDGVDPSQETVKAMALYAAIRDLESKGFQIFGLRLTDKIECTSLSSDVNLS